jgi:hypothetical protein
MSEHNALRSALGEVKAHTTLTTAIIADEVDCGRDIEYVPGKPGVGNSFEGAGDE